MSMIFIAIGASNFGKYSWAKPGANWDGTISLFPTVDKQPLPADAEIALCVARELY